MRKLLIPALAATALIAMPLVSTDGGALPEIVGDAGVIVPAADGDALADALANLLDDPDRRRRLAEAGRARILERYSWTVCATQLVTYYREVIREVSHDADR